MTNRHSSIQSLVSFRNSQGDAARGTLLKLDRSKVVFEVYNPYSIVQLSEMLQDLTIRRKERIIYQGRAVVSNLVNTGLMLIVSVTLVDPWVDLTGLLYSGNDKDILVEAKHFISDWERAYILRPGYLLSVNKLRSFLSELSRWLEQVDVHTMEGTSSGSQEVAIDIFRKLEEPLLSHMAELFHEFEYEASQIPEDEVDKHKAFVQRDLHPLMLRAPFVYRTYVKPLGYAGDYEMMNMIHRNVPEGPNTYAKLINTVYVQSSISQSVRNRTNTLYGYLVRESQRSREERQGFSLLSIGCGPAIEIQRFVKSIYFSEAFQFTLFDFNQETLKYAESIVKSTATDSGKKVDIKCIHESVHVLLKKAASHTNTEQKMQYDFVYCLGLFDYLSDKTCARLIKLFYSWIRPGGVVLVTNMHPSNEDRFAMEHIAEWYLVYRNELQMADIVKGLGKQKVYIDDTGVNIYLEIRKPINSRGLH